MGVMQEGLRAFGAWEPLAHRIRGGRAETRCRIEDTYKWEHSEEFIKGLKDRGFNLFITHFSKGYGIEAEALAREDTKRIADLCHEHGMYVGGYVRYSTLIPDTMKQEVPDCVERFASITAMGTPARYGGQYWRYMPCPSSTDYLEYLDRLIGIGVEEIGLDCLHVDGVALRHEPFACHCDRCKAGFREWLEERYPTAADQEARLGFAGFEYVQPPEYHTSPVPAYPLPIMRDPVAQEWVLFRCSLLEKLWRALVESAHRRNPDCVVQGNTSFYPGLNAAWYSSAMVHRLARCGSEGFFTEEGNAPDLTEDGRLHGYFETFKKLRSLGFLVFTYNREPITHKPCTEPERVRRAMAHQMAFNRDSAGVFCAALEPGKWPVADPDYMTFHRDRRDLFRDAHQVHDVAIYFSDVTRAFNCGTPIVTANLARDVLMRTHVPFGYLLAERREAMSEYRALVLPEVECMTQPEAEDIAAYVKAGGGLLIIGANTGRYDATRRLHRENALAAALGVECTDDTPTFTARVGDGKVAFIPMLVTQGGTPDDLVRAGMDRAQKGDGYFHLDLTAWSLPRNAGDMVDLLRWSAGRFRFEMTARDTVVTEFVRQENPPRHLVHLVNFDLEHDAGPFEISVHGLGKPSRVQAFTPDGPAPAVELTESDGNQAAVSVPGFHRYLIVAIE